MAVYGELGRYPIDCFSKKQRLKYFNQATNSDNTLLIREAYLVNKNVKGDSRYASPEASLSNCSWYSQSACCKRTEVTSVFGGMYSLYGASTACQSRLNYMMCYFCSPAQGEWYDNHVRICMEFCDDTYTNCMNAKYNGHTIGEKYRNGRHFCESQQFEVVHSKQGCFDFDPGAFGSSTMSALHKVVFLISVFVSILNTV
uniref:Uncharacterized protein LOC102807164 n=1 Tax=Saccoglossus kowalevskii TaxID=10224 RepID=A0ABM0MX05_SACKO|nr:PREDICTED: uncharacterized protein LOC102807164 [Saccoglossus kowalevskii]